MIGLSFLVGTTLLAAGALATPPQSLSGSWLFGADRPEPKAAIVLVPPRCWSADVAVRLVDTDGKLSGTISWIAATQGVPPSRQHDESERLSGTRVGDRVRMTGAHRVVETAFANAYLALPAGPPTTTVTRVRYDLRFDRKTGHLVGTRDGQPFWLAPFKVRPARCGAPPP